jgi:hypothetical protein
VRHRCAALTCTLAVTLVWAAPAAAATAGWDTLRRLDLLPLMRPGERAHMFSSWDRTGDNNDGLTGRFSCLRRMARRCVIAEARGPGEIDSMWFTRAGPRSARVRFGDVRRTGTIRVELDGRRVLDAPLQAVVDGRLGAPFTFPAVANAAQASGAVYIKVPMPFRRSMRVSTQFNPRYYHVNYRTFPSPGVVTFSRRQRAADVLAILRAAGGRDPKPPAVTEGEARPVVVAAGGSAALSTWSGPGTVTELRLRPAAPLTPEALQEARLAISFDGRERVSSPLGEFFGSGLGPVEVRGLLMAQTAGGELVSWWPMPFREGVAVSLHNPTAHPLELQVQVRVARAHPAHQALARGRAGYFRTTSRRGPTQPGRPWRVLEAQGRGLLVGLSATLRGSLNQRYLEGDERIVADGRVMRGTGTEDFFEGGFYWQPGPVSLPLVGSPAHLRLGPPCPTDCVSAYRLLVADAVPFARHLRFTLEHGNRNRVPGDYSTTAFWYGP